MLERTYYAPTGGLPPHDDITFVVLRCKAA